MSRFLPSVPVFCGRFGGVACSSVLAAVAVSAQSSTNAPVSTTATNAPPSTMEKTVVEGLALNETILPTARPINSVLGDDRSIVDTPRSVSLITKAQVEERGISRMTDLGQLVPGAYTPERYGLPGVPLIRGDLAEIYQNGQRMLFSRDSILPSFNQVEAIDVVKGPGSAVFGPQGEGPGGYVNFVTKQPYFDAFHGEVSTRLGTYVPGGASYLNPEATLDFGGPITKELAYRVSYLERQGDSYYQNVKDRTHDVFAALDWRPNDKLELDLTAQYIDARFNEVTGINRVTQELIDHHIYNAGPANLNFGYNWVLNTNSASKVKIYGYDSLTSPGDAALGEKFNTQLISTYHLNDDAKIVNLSYFEYLNSSKLEYYGYTEYVPENWTMNNRTELHYDFDIDAGKKDFPIKTISGIDFRYTRLKSYQDFSTEPFFMYDLSVTDPAKQAQQFHIPGIVAGQSVGGGYNVPGHPGFGANPFPSSGTQDTYLYDTALFTQWDIAVFDKFSVVAGGRADLLDANTANPEIIDNSGKVIPRGGMYAASKSLIDSSVFVSGLYKWEPTQTSYVTYNLVDAVTGSANFGGVDGTAGNAGLKTSLTAESELIEVGHKVSLFGNQVYAAASLFKQTKASPALVGPPTKIDLKGLEFETVYQPNRNFHINANATFQDAYKLLNGGSFYQQTTTYLDGYPVGFIQDGRSGTGQGSPNYNGANPPTYTRVHQAATPHVLLNAYASYEFDNGFGFSFGPQIQGSQRANYSLDGYDLKIPAQYVINASIFYRKSRWEVRLNLDNITDQKNWTAIDPDFAGNDVIFPQLPFHITGLIKFRF